MARSYQTKGSDGASSLTTPIANYVNIYALAAATADLYVFCYILD